ncbi:MAG: oligosaccharide flippase family protein [Clostridia bacterium]|nr:oligosaccharide flippase family protein [Clostridia bacterium]
MAKSKKVIKAVATVTVFSVFTRGLSFIFKIYLSRALGAEVVGLYQICISMFYLFACFSASGIPLVLSRKTAEGRALKTKHEFSLFSSALAMGVCISVAVVLVLSIARPLLPKLLSEPKTVPMFVIMLPAIISTTIYSIVRGWFWGSKQFTSFSITETVEEVFRIIFSALFVSGLISGLSGYYGIALAFTVSDILVAVILLIMFFVKGGKLAKPTKIKEILLPSMPITAMRVFGGLISTMTAILLPARLVQAGFSVAEATASFGRIAGMAMPLLLAPNAIISSLAIVLIPEMSENGVKNDHRALNRQLNSGINFALLISGGFMLCFFCLGEELTQFLFNDRISGKYLQVASFVMLPVCVSQLTQSALNSIGLEFKAFINYMAGTALLVGCIYFLPAYIGIYSVAVASMLSLIVSSIMNLRTLREKTGFRPDFLKIFIMVLLFVFPCGYFSYSLYGILSHYMRGFALIPALPLGFGMYVALCAMTELIDVKAFIKRKFGRPLLI